jgi:hypothetical protein
MQGVTGGQRIFPPCEKGSITSGYLIFSLGVKMLRQLDSRIVNTPRTFDGENVPEPCQKVYA